MKKIVYPLGIVALTAAPITIAVGCGSSSSQTVDSLEKGSIKDFYKYENGSRVDKNQANTKIATNGRGELFQLGGSVNLGFKYLIQADDTLTFNGTKAVDKTFQTLNSELIEQVANSMVQSSVFTNLIANEFQFITIVILDVNDKSLKATKNIFIPQVFKASLNEAAWKAQIKKTISTILENQKMSFSPSVIPVTVYDAPASNAVTISYSDDIIKLVRMEGQKIPKLNDDGTLPSALVESIVNSTLKNQKTVEAMTAGETEYAPVFYNQMYISSIANIMNIDATSVLPRIIRENSLVADNAFNDVEIPFMHLPQNPTNFDRTFKGFSDKLASLKFTKSDPDFYFTTSSYSTWNAGYELEINDDFSSSILSNAVDVANASGSNVKVINTSNNSLQNFKENLTSRMLNNNYIQSISQSNNTLAKLNLTSKAEVYDAIHNNTNGYIHTLNNLSANTLIQWEGLDRDDTVTQEQEKVVFNAMKFIVKKLWQTGSIKNGHGTDLGLSEIQEAIKHVSDFESGAATTVTETDFILSTLFEWTATRFHNVLYGWSWFDKDAFVKTKDYKQGDTIPNNWITTSPELGSQKFDARSTNGISALLNNKYLGRNKDIYKINWYWDSNGYKWQIVKTNQLIKEQTT